MTSVRRNDFFFYTGNNMLDAYGTFVEGKAGGHGIMENIALCALVYVDGYAVVYVLTDFCSVACAPLSGGVFLNLFINGGSAVFCVDGSIRVGGGKTAESTHGGVDEVITEFKSGEYAGASPYA